MATDKDVALVRYLMENTANGKLKWEPTAVESQFITNFQGKYSIKLDQATTGDRDRYWITLLDRYDRELLSLTAIEIPDIRTLYEMAQRAAFDVDNAIDQIIGLKKMQDDDIPF